MRAVRYGICNPDGDEDGKALGKFWGNGGLLLVSLNGGIGTAFCVVELALEGLEWRCVGDEH